MSQGHGIAASVNGLPRLAPKNQNPVSAPTPASSRVASWTYASLGLNSSVSHSSGTR